MIVTENGAVGDVPAMLILETLPDGELRISITLDDGRSAYMYISADRLKDAVNTLLGVAT